MNKLKSIGNEICNIMNKTGSEICMNKIGSETCMNITGSDICMNKTGSETCMNNTGIDICMNKKKETWNTYAILSSERRLKCGNKNI